MSPRPTTPRRTPRPSSNRPLMVSVQISNRQRSLAIDRRWLGSVVRKALAAIDAHHAQIGIAVVDDAGIAALHDRWMGLPDPTDVITFDLSSPESGVLEGDIAVSAETARRVARRLGWLPRHELAYYVVHGLLHLAGEDDLEAGARRRMRIRERKVMASIGLPPPPRRPVTRTKR